MPLSSKHLFGEATAAPVDVDGRSTEKAFISSHFPKQWPWALDCFFKCAVVCVCVCVYVGTRNLDVCSFGVCSQLFLFSVLVKMAQPANMQARSVNSNVPKEGLPNVPEEGSQPANMLASPVNSEVPKEGLPNVPEEGLPNDIPEFGNISSNEIRGKNQARMISGVYVSKRQTGPPLQSSIQLYESRNGSRQVSYANNAWHGSWGYNNEKKELVIQFDCQARHRPHKIAKVKKQNPIEWNQWTGQDHQGRAINITWQSTQCIDAADATWTVLFRPPPPRTSAPSAPPPPQQAPPDRAASASQSTHA